jgi:hypothetical protein
VYLSAGEHSEGCPGVVPRIETWPPGGEMVEVHFNSEKVGLAVLRQCKVKDKVCVPSCGFAGVANILGTWAMINCTSECFVSLR